MLGLLLGLGPLFIVMFLFDATRGVFEGWLRATLAFAFVPLVTILLLGVMLVILEPNLVQLEQQNTAGVFGLGPTYAIMILIMVFVGVMSGALIAIGVIANGFKLPTRARASTDPADVGRTAASQTLNEAAVQSTRGAGPPPRRPAMERTRRHDSSAESARARRRPRGLIERRNQCRRAARAARERKSSAGGRGGGADPGSVRITPPRLRSPRTIARAAGGGAGGLR